VSKLPTFRCYRPPVGRQKERAWLDAFVDGVHFVQNRSVGVLWGSRSRKVGASGPCGIAGGELPHLGTAWRRMVKKTAEFANVTNQKG